MQTYKPPFTQLELVMEWVKEFGEINPAHMGGKWYRGVMFGSETTKRCRELYKKGLLIKQGAGRFMKFMLPNTQSKLF